MLKQSCSTSWPYGVILRLRIAACLALLTGHQHCRSAFTAYQICRREECAHLVAARLLCAQVGGFVMLIRFTTTCCLDLLLGLVNRPVGSEILELFKLACIQWSCLRIKTFSCLSVETPRSGGESVRYALLSWVCTKRAASFNVCAACGMSD